MKLNPSVAILVLIAIAAIPSLVLLRQNLIIQ